MVILFHNSRLQLLAFVFALATVWFVLLPRVSRYAPIEQRLDWLDERQIDASAMFYTELDAKLRGVPPGARYSFEPAIRTRGE